MKEKIKKALTSDTAVKIYQGITIASIAFISFRWGQRYERYSIRCELTDALGKIRETGKPVTVKI